MSAPVYDEKPALAPADAALDHDTLDVQPLGLAEEEYQYAVRKLKWKVRSTVPVNADSRSTCT